MLVARTPHRRCRALVPSHKDACLAGWWQRSRCMPAVAHIVQTILESIWFWNPFGAMNLFLFLACACLTFASRAAGICCGEHGLSQQYFPETPGGCLVFNGVKNVAGTAYYASPEVGSCTCPGSYDDATSVQCGDTAYDPTSPALVPDFSNQVAIAAGYCTGQTQVSGGDSYVFCIPASAIGDPHITGFDGTRFEFQGVHGGVFNLISEEGLQLNMALDSFGHADSTFIRSLGFKVGQEATIEISSANATGALELTINGAQQRFPHGTADVANRVKIGSTEVVFGVTGTMEEFASVKTAVLEAVVKRNTGASHLDVDFVILRDVPMHGVLGQTLKWMRSSEKKFEGDEADYLVTGLFSDDFKYNIFQGGQIENRRMLRNAPEISVSASVGKFGKH